jgi:hypothetical protein
MNPVVHFEMPAEDKNRMADFTQRIRLEDADFLRQLGPEEAAVLTAASFCFRYRKDKGRLDPRQARFR